ncbi:MAG: type II toxin-antitoxin system VapC family toxin [Chloroflexia bacterium]
MERIPVTPWLSKPTRNCSTTNTSFTTNFVLDETITLIRYNMHHAAAVRFRHMLQSLIEDGLVELVRVDEAQEDAAWSIFEQYSDQDFSYTDCTSFAVMRQLGLTHVFTADHHFATMGFVLLP